MTSPDQWDLVTGPNKVTAVHSPDDDGTSYIRASDTGYIQRYSLDTPGIPPSSTINSVSVRSRDNCAGTNGGYRQGLALGGNTTESADIIPPGGYVWTDTINALARPGGGSWTLLNLTSLEVYIKCTSSAAWTNVTSLWIIVDYTEAAPTTGDMLLLF